MKMSEDPEERLRPGKHDARESHLADETETEETIDPDRPLCPRCGWHNTRLSHTKGFMDPLFKALSVRAFRCRSCGNRFHTRRRPAKV